MVNEKESQRKDLNKAIMHDKVSIRFYNDWQVRAVWDEEGNKWYFSVIDIISAIANTSDARNYWKVLKNRLNKENNEMVTKCNRFKLLAPDGKRRITDTLDSEGIIALAKRVSGEKANGFLEWFLYSDNTIDGQSKKKAYQLFESGLLKVKDAGTIRNLQQIHAFIFGGLYDFAGQIREKDISKGGFTFAPCMFFNVSLPTIENMPETTFDEIIEKYVEMNVAHPFMEGNGRSTRIWLDLILKRSLKKCVDWSQIDKNDYMQAMVSSSSNPTKIKELIKGALTNKINDREMFMKGIDYSYYYEEN
jgi:cell filamentation protein